jgi:hypothetical protein
MQRINISQQNKRKRLGGSMMAAAWRQMAAKIGAQQCVKRRKWRQWRKRNEKSSGEAVQPAAALA